MKAKLTAMLALITLFQISDVQAAPIDNELAILASEQVQEQKPQTEEKISKPTPKSKKELEAEQKRIRDEQRAEEKRLKKEKEDARKQIEEGRKEQITNSDVRKTPRPRITSANKETDVVRNSAASSTRPSVEPTIESGEKKNETLTSPTEKISLETIQPAPTVQEIQAVKPIPKIQPEINSEVKTEFKQVERPKENSLDGTNSIIRHANFEEVVQVVGFTPLYLPKKSGYTVTEILSIDRRVADIHYGRRWEPEVSLSVRTYKRAADEELQDISGVNGVKWRVDTTGGINVYVAKLSDDTHVAAWAVGDYTFSAYVQNLSFAAFHALVIEELVDLSNHYYIG